MLQGGSAFSQLGLVLKNPALIARVIGAALPNSSNFFVTYVIIQAGALLCCMPPPCKRKHACPAGHQRSPAKGWLCASQSIAMLPFRMMYPHIGSLIGLFRLCGYCSARSTFHDTCLDDWVHHKAAVAGPAIHRASFVVLPGSWLRAGPSHKREHMAAVWPHSIRHGREVWHPSHVEPPLHAGMTQMSGSA